MSGSLSTWVLALNLCMCPAATCRAVARGLRARRKRVGLSVVSRGLAASARGVLMTFCGLALAQVAGAAEEAAAALPTHAAVRELAKAGVWVLVPPKQVEFESAVRLDLHTCRTVWYAEPSSPHGKAAAERLAGRLSTATSLSFQADVPQQGEASIRLAICPSGTVPTTLTGITAKDLAQAGIEGYALCIPEEGRALFDYAAERSMEVHPLFQALGHSYHILHQPQYHHLRIGPCEKTPWIMTFDVRKPEAVSFVNELVDELCAAFPGKIFNVDITEIDCDGMLAAGMTPEQLTDLVYGYVLQLHAMVKRHGMRLMIAQGPLDSTGHLSGMGPKLDTLPKDIIIGSYYCAGGPYAPAWERDFPRLKAKGFDFFAQAWIGSHIRLIPPPQHALDFSDTEISRGLAHGAIGSTTCDWGDAGNYHLTGQTWYPFLYHGTSAWTGATVDRAYFDEAFTRLFYGIEGNSVAQAIHLAGNISGNKVKVRDQEGKVSEAGSYHFWEFFGDPFTRQEITSLADPGAEGQRILSQAAPAVKLLEHARSTARRNVDNLDQLLFGARNFEALGNKLIALSHYNDPEYRRSDVAAEFEAVADTYVALRTEFQRLWLGEDRDNDQFHDHCARFDGTILPLRQKALQLREAQ